MEWNGRDWLPQWGRERSTVEECCTYTDSSPSRRVRIPSESFVLLDRAIRKLSPSVAVPSVTAYQCSFSNPLPYSKQFTPRIFSQELSSINKNNINPGSKSMNRARYAAAGTVQSISGSKRIRTLPRGSTHRIAFRGRRPGWKPCRQSVI